jgi:hypothetical protein
VKVLGRDFKRFWADPVVWGRADVRDSTYVDELLLKVDGEAFDGEVEDVADRSQVEIEAGYLVNPQPKCPEELDKALRWWFKQQANVSVLVEIGKDKLDELDAWLKSVGGVRR